jgi:iron(III) transport system substrate-binding protein
MNKKRLVGSVLVVVLMVAALMPIGGMAAEATGNLVIWSATSAELTQALVDAFGQHYPGINVDIITAGSGELITRLSAEQPNPSGDILLGIGQEAFEGNYGFFTAYKVKDDQIPALLKDTRPEPKYYGMSMPIQAFIVNTKLLKPWEYPRCWKDLALDIYKGKIVMANPSMSGSAYSQVYQMNEIYGFDFLKKVVPNVTFVTSSKMVPEAVARGEYAIGVTGDYNVARKIAEGAPVTVVYPCEGTGARFDASGIIKNGPNLDNAQLFMDWVVTEEALTIVFETRSRRTVHPNVPTPEGLPSLDQVTLIPYDSIKAAEVREDLTMQVVDLIQ